MDYKQRKEVIDKLNHLESKFSVEDWKMGGVHVWPVLKVTLFFVAFDRVNKTQPHAKKSEQASLVARQCQKVQRLVKAMIYFLLLKLEKVDFVFSGASSYRVMFDGESINRYFDPMMAYLRDNNKRCIGIEYNSDHRPIPYKKFDVLLPLFRPPRVYVSPLASNGEFQDFLIDVETFFNLEKEKVIAILVDAMKSVLQWKRLFLYLFKKSQPKYCFGLCYYSGAMWGMNAAAQEVGVTSIDMQHGPQGSLHVAYNFSKLPPKGYDVLPNQFWCWDDDSYRHLKVTLANSPHQAKLSGNPWHEYVLSKNQTSHVVFPTDKPIILYTLQPLEPLVDHYLLKTIQRTKEDYHWWLRLHPRLSSSDKLKLKHVLMEYDLLESVEIEKATEVPLPQLLPMSSLHISKFSGTIIEAATMGLFSIILEKTGIETFKEIVKKGDAIGIEEPSVDSLAPMIKMSLQKKMATDVETTFKMLLDDISS